VGERRSVEDRDVGASPDAQLPDVGPAQRARSAGVIRISRTASATQNGIEDV
jgi:hypothetical protein